jgi:hypothetical protein
MLGGINATSIEISDSCILTSAQLYGGNLELSHTP